MSSNDGKQLLVFGLSFAQHDNRKMQQLLRHYDKLPDNPGSRAGLFVQLNKVARELMADEAAKDQIQKLTDWMTNGGDFPLGVAPAPAPAPTNPGNEARPAQATNNAYQPGFPRDHPLVAGRQVYFGQGRAPSGQQNPANGSIWPGAEIQHPTANLGRQYGRGRTIGGDWEENDDEELEEGEIDGEEEGMDTSMEEEDEVMHDDPMGGFPFMPGRGRLDGSTWGTAFTGPGRTLNDPPEEAGATIAVNEDGAAESTNVERQVAERPQNQPGGLRPRRRIRFAVHGFHGHPRPRPPTEHHEDETLSDHDEQTLTDLDEDLDHDPYGIGSPSHQAELDDGEEIECPICLEDYPRSRFPRRLTITELCDHPDKACLNCLDSSIAAIVERGALHLLACPICPQRLSRRDVKEYANQAVYERYKYLKEQSEIPGHYISCTNPICGGSQPHESEGPMMICNHCEFATCAKHRRPWHEGLTCEEFDLDDAQIERLEEEEATAKLLSHESMSICPKCGQGVTKSEGCDHMRCQCGQEWCYVVSNLPSSASPISSLPSI